MSEQLPGQMTVEEYLKSLREPEDFSKYMNKPENRGVLSVGDKIGRVVLGECRISTITEIEGLPNYPFYRTDSGCCYTYKEGLEDISELIRIAEDERKKYKTVVPKNLKERFTVEYEPRKCDGVILWAQIGIFENMLFWKENCTYQFLEPFKTEKELMKAYEKHKMKMTEESYCGYREVKAEYAMRRLYWSHHGFYSDAEYVFHNG